MVMGSNFHWQDTWTKAVYTGGGGPVCECTVECTLGVGFCPVHPRWWPEITNKRAPSYFGKVLQAASLLGPRDLRGVVEHKPESFLVVSLGKERTYPHLLWKTGGSDTSKMATPKQVRSCRPKDSKTIRFLVNRG